MSVFFDEKLFTITAAAGNKDDIMLEANICRLSNNNLLLTWTSGGKYEPTVENVTYYSISMDNGRHWSDRKILFSHPKKGIFTPEVFTHNGKVFAFLCSYYNDTAFAQDCQSYISISYDNAITFTAPRSIGNAINGVHAKSFIELEDRIIVGVSWIEGYKESWASFEGGNKDCIVANRKFKKQDFETLYHQEMSGVLISEDAGENWRLSSKIGIKGEHFLEPALVELSNGTIAMLMRNAREHLIYISHSYDKGENWSKPVATDIPSAITKSTLLKSKNGAIYLLHNPSETTVRNPLSLWISYNDMKSWDKKIDLVKSDSNEELLFDGNYLIGSSRNNIFTYPDGFIDEERGLLCFAWDDRNNIYYSEYPIK